VKKKECVGDVGKRMRGKLRALLKRTRGLGGRGRLTGKEVDKLKQLLWESHQRGL